MPQMRQLNDGTWLNEDTGIVVAPEAFSNYAGQNDVYTGPPLVPPNAGNPVPPLLPSGRGSMLPNAQAPVPSLPMGGLPGPQLAVSPRALGAVAGEGIKKVLLVAGLVALTYATVKVKDKINGKKKKRK